MINKAYASSVNIKIRIRVVNVTEMNKQRKYVMSTSTTNLVNITSTINMEMIITMIILSFTRVSEIAKQVGHTRF